jgi:hypothetical protein
MEEIVKFSLANIEVAKKDFSASGRWRRRTF